MTDPFVQRYVSPAMARIWDRDSTLELQRELWIRVLDAQVKTGALDPIDGALASYERTHASLSNALRIRREGGTRDPVEYKRTLIYSDYLERLRQAEQHLKHDLKAHLEVFDTMAGGHGLLHVGLTSSDITENVTQWQVWQSADLIASQVLGTLARLANYAETTSDLVIVGRTHGMPAQPTTLGHRYARCAQELLFAYEHLTTAGNCYGRRRGIVGAVGTAADLWHLTGDIPSVERIQSGAMMIAGASVLGSSGQNYPRSLDWEVASSLVQIAMGPASLATTMRLAASQGLIHHGSPSGGYVGSSAMPHKRNPSLWERVCGLQDVLRGYAQMVQSTTGRAWNEGDVSDSVVRRVALPGVFYATDALMRTFAYCLDRVVVNDAAILDELQQHAQQLASGRLLMEFVRRGFSRERAHRLLQAAYRRSVDLVQVVAGELEVSEATVRAWIDGTASEPPGLVLEQIKETCRRVDAVFDKTTSRAEAIAAWELGEIV